MEKMLKLACFGFILYALYHHQFPHESRPLPIAAPVAAPTQDAAKAPILPIRIDPAPGAGHAGKIGASVLNSLVNSLDIDAIMRKKLAEIASNMLRNMELQKPPFTLRKEVVGTGATAYCGAQVELRYEIYEEAPGGRESVENYLTAASPRALQIGSYTSLPGLEIAVIGMKEGGQREVEILPIYAGPVYAAPIYAEREGRDGSTGSASSPSIHAIIHLVAVKSPDRAALEPVSLQSFTTTPGNGRFAQCGDTLRYTYLLKQVNGTSLFPNKTKKLAHTKLLFGNIPEGLQQGLMGMTMGETRSIFLPGASLGPAMQTQYALNPHDTYQIELELLHLSNLPEIAPKAGPQTGQKTEKRLP